MPEYRQCFCNRKGFPKESCRKASKTLASYNAPLELNMLAGNSDFKCRGHEHGAVNIPLFDVHLHPPQVHENRAFEAILDRVFSFHSRNEFVNQAYEVDLVILIEWDNQLRGTHERSVFADEVDLLREGKRPKQVKGLRECRVQISEILGVPVLRCERERLESYCSKLPINILGDSDASDCPVVPIVWLVEPVLSSRPCFSHCTLNLADEIEKTGGRDPRRDHALVLPLLRLRHGDVNRSHVTQPSFRIAQEQRITAIPMGLGRAEAAA